MQTLNVATWQSWSYMFGPLTVLTVLGVLVLVLRWAFGRGGSVVERRPRSGRVGEYGLLVSVAQADGAAEAEQLRAALDEVGLRVTVATTLDGQHVLVFPADAEHARQVLATRRRTGG